MKKHPFAVSETSDWKRLIARSLYRIPILGYCINLITDLLRLPVLIKSIKRHIIDEDSAFQHYKGENDKRYQELTMALSTKTSIDDFDKMISSKASADDVRNLTAGFDEINKMMSSRVSYDDYNDLIVRLGKKSDVSRLDDIDSKLKQTWQDINSKLATKADASKIQELEEQTCIRLSDKTDTIKTEELFNTIRQLEEHIGHRLNEKADAIKTEELVNSLRQLEEHIGHRLNEKADSIRIEEFLHSIDQFSSQLESKANQEHYVSIVDEIMSLKTQILEQKRSLLDQQRRLSLLLEEARKRMPKSFSKRQLQAIADEDSHLLDAMYVSFEDQFRGSRSEIKERLKEYLPYVEKTGAGVSSPIIDLGCGRGEWLELLTENKKNCRGLDLNKVLVSENEDRGFNVTLGDALDFLRSLRDGETEMITSFHVVEHLEHRYLISLIDEAFRVLKPGGAIILETPNPENILVGACNFYFDPTHRNPIPPALLNYLLEARGFINTEILRLNKYPQSFLVKDENLTQFFTAPQDAAVIGFKA